MQQYEQYKDSGVAWLGEVPSHWEVKRLKFLAKIQNGADYKHIETNEGYPVIGSGGQFAYASKYLYKGKSVLLGRKGTIDKPLYIDDAFWTVDTMYYTEISENSNPKFFYYLVLTVDFKKYATQTALPSMTQTTLNNLIFAVPDYEEQTAIATYLDSKLGEIDTLISKQETLLEKLAEQRTAIITHTVTKGLNPEVKMKNSGVEWLGEVPEHWEVLSIKRLSQVKRGASPRPIDNPDYFDDNGEYAWVRIADVTASNTYLFETTQKLSDLGKMFSVPLEPDSLFLSIAGSVGKPIITKIKACIHDGFVYFPEYKNNIKFLYYIFLSGQPYLGLGKMGTQLNLNTDTVGSIKIGLPPLPEQTAIADYLDEQTAQIDRLSERVQQVIDSLKSYRSALITQAVTGKIKVI